MGAMFFEFPFAISLILGLYAGIFFFAICLFDGFMRFEFLEVPGSMLVFTSIASDDDAIVLFFTSLRDSVCMAIGDRFVIFSVDPSFFSGFLLVWYFIYSYFLIINVF